MTTEAELTAREYIRSIRDPLLTVGAARWNTWRLALPPERQAEHLIDDAATRLNLPWPRSRTAETVATYGGFDLDSVLTQPGIGLQKARTIIWAMGLAAWGDDLVALAKDVMRGPEAVQDPAAPTPAAESRDEPDVVGDRLDESISELEDLDPDESAALGLRVLERAVAALAGGAAGGGERGDRLATIVSARLGDSPATLQEIGTDVELTRERVRQLLVKSAQRLRSRASHVQDRFRELYRQWLSEGRSSEDLSRLYRIVTVVFGKQGETIPAPSWSLVETVPALVRRAYLDGETPLDFPTLVERVRQRVGVSPAPDAVRRVCGGERVVLIEHDGQELVYSDSSKDRIHRALMEADRPLDHEGLEAATGLPRGTLYSLSGKDSRLIQQDDGTWVPFRDLPVREADGWVIDGWRKETSGDVFDDLLSDVFANVTPRRVGRERAEIPLGAVVQQAISDLAQANVYNATVWGFWRACAAVAERDHGAELPEAVSAVPLGRLAVDRTSHVDTGGKRRVASSQHPDRADVQDNVYWVRKALARVGGPCTPSEFSRALDADYQDGPDYLHKMWIEFYGEEIGVYRFAPESRPNMSILVSATDERGVGAPTSGVRRLARRLAGQRGSRYPPLLRSEFVGVEWLATLVDETAGGYDWGS